MCIDARRDMEEKLKQERDSLMAAMNTSSRSEKEAAMAQMNLQKDREMRLQQRTWDEERGRLERELGRVKGSF
jgi:hypothetical protein